MLAALVLVSAILVTLESSTGLVQPLRQPLEDIVSPLLFVSETPYWIGAAVGETFSSRDQLQKDNATLRRKVLELAQISQLYLALKTENDRLRELLGSQGRVPFEVLIAELVGVSPEIGHYEIVIDKGSAAGVKPGQAVLDATGLFGQVVSVATYTSRVLLVVDRDHAVPVQINRNGVRSIAGGTGNLQELVLENVPISADIVEGDLVETSGLGGRFPPGYPVGVVESVLVEPTLAYAQVTVKPSAQLDRSRHVLVIFKDPPQSDVQADFSEPQAPDLGEMQ